jgi:hypothetical protein
MEISKDLLARKRNINRFVYDETHFKKEIE